MRHSFAAAALLAAATTLTAPPAAAATTCRDVHAPVTVLGSPETVHGRLCTPGRGATTVEVLVPGATYNSAYWDYPDGAHSFRAAQNAAGFATFALDRLGTGGSSRPVAATLTATAQAAAVHQVVQGLRSGAYGPAFTRVVIGGHSLGAAIGVLVAGAHHDVDGVLLTGIAHRVNPGGVVGAFANFVPANLDPKFGVLHPLGYLTTAAGKRYESFHAPGPLPAPLRELEEATKDVFSPTEAVDGLAATVLPPYSLLINVPVLSVVGSEDTAVCGPLATNCSTAETLREAEAPYFTAPLRTHVVTGYGHSINLAPDAARYYAVVAAWVAEEVER
ncbi:alpha/beta hydrolase [Saccharothrix obliqua]|uniref:alpha/beta hydrolase n=1 Tax=Saccharothrix obliqua TaxID=2861747 RepID=UPI001C5F8AC1|nr:alpha/beta fold hydrolase [Saccharothrix obliqua]MBW4717809.1 lysophospholipase [Saccharothrix obliqua]